MFHPQLLPATLGLAVGLVVIAYLTWTLVRRWRALSPVLRGAFVALLVVLQAGVWLNLYAWFVEPNQLVVREVRLESAQWRGPPLRIAMLSDTHVGGPHVDAVRVSRIVARINELAPDIVVLLGDYVNGHAPEAARTPRENSEVQAGLAAFAGLQAPFGAVAVIGNHDVWYGRESIVRGLEQAGVTVLGNGAAVADRPAGPFAIVGLEDDWTEHPDFNVAFAEAPRGDAFVISHSPDPFPNMPPQSALMLAGHGHCGQVTVPFVGRPITPLRNPAYVCGLIQDEERVMFVTGGVGTSILPVRFLNPPEIVVVTLSATPDLRDSLPEF